MGVNPLDSAPAREMVPKMSLRLCKVWFHVGLVAFSLASSSLNPAISQTTRPQTETTDKSELPATAD